MVLAFHMVFDKIQTKLRDTEAMEDGDSPVLPWMRNNEGEERERREDRSFVPYPKSVGGTQSGAGGGAPCTNGGRCRVR